MTDFLNRYMRMPDTNTWAVDQILDVVQGQQANVEELLKLLANRDRLASLQIGRYTANSLVRSGPIASGFRDANRYLRNLYSDSNDVDILLDNMETVLGSRIKGLEDEVYSLEKMLDSFAFYLADGKKYDGFFIETFSDTLNLNTDLDFTFSDRDGYTLSKSHVVNVDTVEGVAEISGMKFNTYPLNLTMQKINHFPVNKWEQGIGGSMRSVLAVIESNNIIANEYTPDFVKVGVEDAFHQKDTTVDTTAKGLVLSLTYDVASPSYSEMLKLRPLSNKVVEVNQIYLYSDPEHNRKVPLLDAPIVLQSPRTISFEGQMVARIEVVLRQPEYKRRAFLPKVRSEASERMEVVSDRYKKAYSDSLLPIDNPIIRKPESWFEYNSFNRTKDNDRGNVVRALKGEGVHSGRASLRAGTMTDLASSLRRMRSPNFGGTSKGDGPGLENGQFPTNESVRNIMYESGLRAVSSGDIHQIIGAKASGNRTMKGAPYDLGDSAGFISSPAGMEPVLVEGDLKYTYEIGLGDIELGAGTASTKAVYVSSPIEMDGDPGVVRLSAVDHHAVSLDKSRDSKYISSVEYSVSNTSYPEREEHWYPILPHDQEEVIAERVFIDSAGLGRFRFTASVDESIYVYVNGVRYTESITPLLVHDEARQGYTGLRVHPKAFGYSDFITVDYTPLRRFSSIDFSNDPVYENDLPLSYPQNPNGKGEKIRHSEGRKEYSLSNVPYISNDLVRSATYNASSGLSYKPITIVFDDGQGAINLTNYQMGIQTSLDPNAQTYQFLHSNGVITFNKAPTSDFVVVYKFIPARLRVRAVLRCNNPSFATSGIDLIQVKAKLRKPGTQRI